jgi:hypothetical protein
MMCSCGGETYFYNRMITRQRDVLDWTRGQSYPEIRVAADICRACGRQRAKIYDSSGKLLRTVG